MERKNVEKIEVAKNNGNFYYTGILTELDDQWVEIRTTRGEVLRFRKQQIQQRRAVDTNGDDTNGNEKGNKNI